MSKGFIKPASIFGNLAKKLSFRIMIYKPIKTDYQTVTKINI
jgi:hypothetical protein